MGSASEDNTAGTPTASVGESRLKGSRLVSSNHLKKKLIHRISKIGELGN